MRKLEQIRARPLAMSLVLLVLTVLLGIAIRFAPLGLPWPIRKYGGSVLWAAMLYWLVSTLLGHVRLRLVAVLTEALAVLVEFFKRVHTPALDSFRTTVPGILLLGREFSFVDIAAYTVAIAFAALADGRLRMSDSIRQR